MTEGLPPIVCVIGRKNAGKTELTVRLGAELNRRGYRVMTVKHAHGFQMDQPGRDSWRHRHEGGALRTVLASPADFAVIGSWPEKEMDLSELVRRFLWDADIVLAEGFKELYRSEGGGLPGRSDSTPFLEDGDEHSSGIFALVTDRPGVEVSVPVFDLTDGEYTRDLVTLLEEKFLNGRSRP